VVTIPAFMWRGGFVFRALTAGATLGVCLGVLAWLDSGHWLAGLAVFVIVGVSFGLWTPLRMARYWPAAAELDGADRTALVRAARAGRRIAEPRLLAAAEDYARGMHAAAERTRMRRGVLVFVLVVALVVAVWDTVSGTWGNVAVSVIYLMLLLLELFWWPHRQAQLLANTERACG
jgi:hypothetical protein